VRKIVRTIGCHDWRLYRKEAGSSCSRANRRIVRRGARQARPTIVRTPIHPTIAPSWWARARTAGAHNTFDAFSCFGGMRSACFPIHLFSDSLVFRFTCFPIHLFSDSVVSMYALFKGAATWLHSCEFTVANCRRRLLFKEEWFLLTGAPSPAGDGRQ